MVQMSKKKCTLVSPPPQLSMELCLASNEKCRESVANQGNSTLSIIIATCKNNIRVFIRPSARTSIQIPQYQSIQKTVHTLGWDRAMHCHLRKREALDDSQGKRLFNFSIDMQKPNVTMIELKKELMTAFLIHGILCSNQQ